MKFLKRALYVFSTMPGRKKITASVLAVVFMLSLGQFVRSQLETPVRSEKGVFAEGMVGHVKVLNPVFADFNETDRDVTQLVFSGLMRYDPVQKNFFPDLAESWDRDSRGTTYTFTLKPNVLWHDGKPFTSEDVYFTFHDVIQDPGFKNPILKGALEGVTVQAPDPNTIVFILPRSNSYFVSNLTVGILPKHSLETAPIATLEKSGFGSRPIGTGPYRLTSLHTDSDGDVVDLAAFAQYYGEKPKIEKIRLYTFPTESDLAKERSSLHAISRVVSESNFEKRLTTDGRFTLYPYTLNQFTALYFNTENPFLKEKGVRRSLVRGLNKENLVLPGEKRVDTIELASRPDDPNFAFNVEMAQKALDSLGWKLNANGLRYNTKGEPFTLTLLANSKIPSELTARIASDWKAVGAQITIETAEGEQFAKLVNERRYSVLLIRQNLGYNRDVYPLFHSSQVGSSQGDSGLNFANYKSFPTDGLTEAIRKERDPKSKEKLLKELSRTLTDEMPIVLLSTPVYDYALDNRISAFPTDNLDLHSDRLRLLPYLTSSNL